MTDLEISAALALAIGWKESNFHYANKPVAHSGLQIIYLDAACLLHIQRVFDYRDPAVIWPIAERFDCFPWKSIKDDKEVWCAEGQFARFYESCSKKAVAMAVIGGAG